MARTRPRLAYHRGLSVHLSPAVFEKVVIREHNAYLRLSFYSRGSSRMKIAVALNLLCDLPRFHYPRVNDFA